MSHPYKDQVASSHKSKAGNMGKVNNLDIPVMRAVGENSAGKLYSSSSSSQQQPFIGLNFATDGSFVGGRTLTQGEADDIIIAALKEGWDIVDSH